MKINKKHIMPLNYIERRLIAELLMLASNQFANNGCNDFTPETSLSKEDKEQLAADFELWNSRGEQKTKFEHIGDASWMHYFASRLRSARQ